MTTDFMIIDGQPVLIEDEKNLLELIRKAGIELPVFCYYSELSVYGACRMCMVENQWGSMEAACSTPPKAGMEIKTNTPKLRRYRKMILELLLSNHCRDCTTCSKNESCKLQELARRFGMNDVRFPNSAEKPDLDASSLAITRDRNKCILCGDCVRMCDEIQNVGAIDFISRGSKMSVGPAFDKPIADSNCVGCGQCAAVCPTAAIVIKNDLEKLQDDLSDPKVKVVAQIAPAVRVAIGEELGVSEGDNVLGKIIASLHRLGFDDIHDTATGADLTVLEESAEFINRLEKGEKLPLFTSCCPAWVQYVEKNFPEMIGHLSSCRSPMQMLASVMQKHYKLANRKIKSVAIMPCTAKKIEAAREEFKDEDGHSNVDYVITTQELIQLIRESGIVFKDIEPESLDGPFGVRSGAGVIFGVSGGVTEAVLRRISDDKSVTYLKALAFHGVRGLQGVKESSVEFRGRKVKIAVVSGLRNASDLVKKIMKGDLYYDFIEVMACPGGCVGGAGQPYGHRDSKVRRGDGLYKADNLNTVKRSEENTIAISLYSDLLRGNVHEMLHVDYTGKGNKS